MKFSNLNKYLGRHPNKSELSFINAIKKSYDVQNSYYSELNILKNNSNRNVSSLLIATSKNDPRGIIGQNIIQSQFLREIKLFSNQNKKLFVGLTLKKYIFEKPKFGCLFFIKRSHSKHLINKIKSSNLKISVDPIHKSGLGFSIYNFLKHNNCGLLLNITAFDILYKKSINGLLLQVDNRSLKEFKSLTSSYNIKTNKLGSLLNEQVIKNDSKSNESIMLPIKIIDTFINQNNVHDEDIMQNSIVDYIKPNLKIKKNYNVDLKTILDKTSKNNYIDLIKVKKETFGYCSHDIDYIKYDDYFMNATALISNASRKLICNGIIPECGSGFISTNKINNSLKKSFLKGIHSAANHLNINMDHFSFIPSNSSLLGNFYIFGRRVINRKIENKFNDSDHFISILGTHTGELGGSKYLSIYKNDIATTKPTVDLLTEARLQIAVIEAFKGNLIETATPIHEGGLATTLARLLNVRKNLGARVHFSSKIEVPQVLFGETQGLVIVSLKESNIMELERLCMSIGIPNTTIGRITNNGVFSFNDNIKIKVKDIF